MCGYGEGGGEGNGNPPVFLPGESHGGRSLVGFNPRGRRESDTTELLHFTSLHGEGGTEGREPQGKQMLQRLSCPERKLWACPVAISGSPQP